MQNRVWASRQIELVMVTKERGIGNGRYPRNPMPKNHGPLAILRICISTNRTIQGFLQEGQRLYGTLCMAPLRECLGRRTERMGISQGAQEGHYIG